ncbi:MAG: Fe-S cluster assembly sulfur transfer protein SufU [Burkholderiales bacterium]
MAEINQLYDDVMLDHIRNARNYRWIEDADVSAKRFNPLCGDELTVYLRLAGETIHDIAFQCSCCGISMASASMMTEQVKGKPRAQAQAIVRAFRERLRESHDVSPDDLAVLYAVRDFPTRKDCAGLAWDALAEALQRT